MKHLLAALALVLAVGCGVAPPPPSTEAPPTKEPPRANPDKPNPPPPDPG